jgi:hypothetical protein
MRRTAFHSCALIALLASLTLACARSVAVGTQPGATYSIEVRNSFNEEMIVSYNDGSGPRTLGSVPAARTERFVIVPPSSSSISVSATNAARTRSFGPVQLSAVPGGSGSVVLR